MSDAAKFGISVTLLVWAWGASMIMLSLMRWGQW